MCPALEPKKETLSWVSVWIGKQTWFGQDVKRGEIEVTITFNNFALRCGVLKKRLLRPLSHPETSISIFMHLSQSDKVTNSMSFAPYHLQYQLKSQSCTRLSERTGVTLGLIAKNPAGGTS